VEIGGADVGDLHFEDLLHASLISVLVAAAETSRPRMFGFFHAESFSVMIDAG